MSHPRQYRHAQMFNLLVLSLVISIFTKHVASQIQQQLVGCETLSCPSTGCTLGNATNAFLGATSFTASLPSTTSSVELTWTVGALAQNSGSGSSSSTKDTLFTKNFYLGYPPTLDLANTSSTAGCALLFEGIARSIPLNGSEYGSMTCGSALGDQCVNDLLQQAEGLVNGQGQTVVCADVQAQMQATPPPTCLGVAMVTWGSVVAKDLTTSQTIPQTTCHPSVAGAGYNVALVETQTVRSEDVSSDLAPFFYSLTPVLSVFYSPESQSDSAHAYLSCLKVIDAAAGAVATQTQTSDALSLRLSWGSLRQLFSLVVGLMLVGVLGRV